jgi:hypothetical protein
MNKNDEYRSPYFHEIDGIAFLFFLIQLSHPCTDLIAILFITAKFPLISAIFPTPPYVNPYVLSCKLFYMLLK